MNRVKSSLLIAFVAIAATLSAQTFRLQVGYNNPKRFGKEISSTYFNSLQIGPTAEIKLKNNFSLLSGALYSIVYSNKVQKYYTNNSVTYMSIGHFIDVPVRLTYSYPIAKSLNIFGYAGPNLNIGISQFQGTVAMLETSLSKYTGIINATKDLYKSDLNRLNLQIGVGGGVQWKEYQIKSGYDFGLNTLNKTGNSQMRQSGWYISLAYQF